MKVLQITTKTKADAILVDSLFNPVNGRTLNRMKYCTGKYKPGAYVGTDVRVSDDVHAVYTSRQRDKDGPFIRLMCVCEA